MANPNLLAAGTALGTTTYLTPNTAAGPKVLLPNAAGSGQVFKINHIRATNSTASAAVSYVNIFTNGSVAQGGNPSSGVAYDLTGSVSIAANSALIVVDKTTQIYLQEGTSIIVGGGTSSIDYVISYEVIYV
jgi:hypothetical protein